MRKHIGFSVGAALLCLMPHFIVRAAALPALAYNFAPGQTNAYRVRLSSTSESNPQRSEGVIVVGVRSVENGRATVFFGGTLQPLPMERERQRFGGPFGGGVPFGRFGPAFPGGPGGALWPSMPMTTQNETVIDSRGRILRSASLLDLGKPLENYASVFFHPLPEDIGKGIESEAVIQVEDELGGNGRTGFGARFGPPGFSGGSRLTGTRKESVRLIEGSPEQVRFEQSVDFRTWLKTGDDPRLSFNKKAEFVFVPGEGALKSGKIEGTAMHSTADFTMKAPVVLTFERLEGDELKQALVNGGFNKPEAVTERDFESLFEQLKSDDPPKRVEAANLLASVEVEKHAATLLPHVRPFLGSGEPPLRNLAARVMGAAATRDDVPLLLKILRSEDQGDQYPCLQALRRLKDKRAIEPLADLIARGSGNSFAAAEALAQFGPAVEDVALALLKEKHIETKRSACRILQETGTNKSAEAMQAIVTGGDPALITMAAETLRAIRNRGEEAAKLVF